MKMRPGVNLRCFAFEQPFVREEGVLLYGTIESEDTDG